MKNQVIALKNIPPKLPIGTLIAFWLLLDRLEAPEWLMGIYWFLAAMIIISTIIVIVKTEYIDIFSQKLR